MVVVEQIPGHGARLGLVDEGTGSTDATLVRPLRTWTAPVTEPSTPERPHDPWRPQPYPAGPPDPWAAPVAPPTYGQGGPTGPAYQPVDGSSPAYPPPGYPPAGYPPQGYPPQGYPNIPGYPNGPGYPPYGSAPSGATFWPTDPGWMEFDPAKPAPRWGMPDIILGILAYLVGSFVGALAAVVLTDDRAVLVIGGLVGSWVGIIAFLFLISRVKGQGSFRDDFGFKVKGWDPLIGLGAGFFALFSSGIAQLTVAAAIGTEPKSNANDIFGPMENNRVGMAIMAIMATIGAPLVEELLFRGLAVRAIDRRLGGIVAVLGSAVVFSLLHINPPADGGTWATVPPLIAGILVYGVIFAVLTRWFRRLGPAIFAHITINGLSSILLVYSVFSGSGIPG